MFFVITFGMTLVMLMIGSTWFFSAMAARVIGNKHRIIQSIIETGKVPHDWSHNFLYSTYTLLMSWCCYFLNIKLGERKPRHYLKELDSLIHYVKISPLIEDELTRNLLRDNLSRVRSVWQHGE